MKLALLLLTFTLPAFATSMPGMTTPPPVTSEFTFLAGMVPHHQGALEDARLAEGRSERPKIRELAETIIAEQEAEVAQMEGWLAAWYPDRDRTQAAAEAEQRMAGMATGDLANLSGDAFDRAFLERMTMHHQMAVQMVDSLLGQDLVAHAEVRTLAQNIRKTQNAEIAQMQGWLERWFGAASDTGHRGH